MYFNPALSDCKSLILARVFIGGKIAREEDTEKNTVVSIYSSNPMSYT